MVTLSHSVPAQQVVLQTVPDGVESSGQDAGHQSVPELRCFVSQQGNDLFTLQIPGAEPKQRQFCLHLLPETNKSPQPTIPQC